MFVIKKLVSPFMVPPGLLVLLLLVSGAWFLRRKNLQAAVFNMSLGLLLWLFSLPPAADILLRPLEAGLHVPENPDADVIVVLGAGIYDGVPDMSGTGAPQESALSRIVTAVRLQRKMGIPVILSGGRIFKNRDAEAPVMKRFLLDLGVPENMVFLENSSRDTIENAGRTKELCAQKQFKKLLIVTTARHMKRAILSFRKAGIEAIPFPCGFKTSKTRRYGWADLLPTALDATAGALKEYLGLLFYTLAY
ncbi:MAG: YdcF family protein [bacterium]